jgi:hypothetical protein
MESRGNHLSLYYKNEKISFWTGDLSNEEPPEFEIVKYSDAFPKPARAFPYDLDTLRTSLRNYGPAVRYPIVHLEMIRMHKRSVDLGEENVPPMEGMMEFVASSYPKEVRDAMCAAIRVVQTEEVTRSTFEKVEQLAMGVAVIYQEPKLRKALEESDPQLVESLLQDDKDVPDKGLDDVMKDISDEPFVEVVKQDATCTPKNESFEESVTADLRTGVEKITL